MPTPIRALARLAVAAAVAASPAAAQVTVGSPNGIPGQCQPFGCFIMQSRYQQVYAASAFPGAMTITGLTFYKAAWPNPTTGQLTPGLFTFRLSTTTRPANALLLDLDQNVAAGTQQLFAAVTLGGLTPDLLTVTGTPFTYDPSQGNLLLDVVTVLNAPPDEVVDEALFSYFQADFTADVTSSAVTLGDPREFEFTVPTNGGLVTTFEGTPAAVPPPSTSAPEPAPLALLVAGLAALVAVPRVRSTKRF
jgi:hypothetical protein